MTASLYQSGSSAGAASWPAGSGVRVGASTALQEVVEVLLAVQASAHAEYVRGRALRVELHEIARAIPHIARAGEQVVHLVGAVGLDAQQPEVELHPAAVRVVRAQVHDADNLVGAVRRLLDVGDKLVVVGAQEPKAGVGLQRRILAPDA